MTETKETPKPATDAEIDSMYEYVKSEVGDEYTGAFAEQLLPTFAAILQYRAIIAERDKIIERWERVWYGISDRGGNLEDGRTITCAFCGEAYPPGTPTSQHQLLTDHVDVCKNHPIAAVKAERDRLTKEVTRLTKKLTDLYELAFRPDDQEFNAKMQEILNREK